MDPGNQHFSVKEPTLTPYMKPAVDFFSRTPTSDKTGSLFVYLFPQGIWLIYYVKSQILPFVGLGLIKGV